MNRQLITLLALLLPLALLTGCAGMSAEEKQARLAEARAQEYQQLAALNAPQPLITFQGSFTCDDNSDEPCGFTVYNPNQKTVLPAQKTNGWDFANTLVRTTAGVATSVAPWAAITAVAVDGITHAGAQNSYNTQTATTSGDQVSSGDVVTSGDVTGDTTTSDSYNTDTAGDTTTSGDSTVVDNGSHQGDDGGDTSTSTSTTTTTTNDPPPAP